MLRVNQSHDSELKRKNLSALELLALGLMIPQVMAEAVVVTNGL